MTQNYERPLKMAENLGFNAKVQNFPSIYKRGPLETVYYAVIRKLPFLQKILPTTANFIFIKP